MVFKEIMNKGLILGLSTFFLINNACIYAPRVELQTKKDVNSLMYYSALYDIDDWDIENAITKVEFLTEMDKNNSKYHSSLGLLYEFIGDKERASIESRKALSLDPDSISFYKEIAVNSAAEMNYERSIFYMGLIMEKDSRNPIHHNFLGVLYNNLGMYDEGIKELYKAIELDNSYAEAYLNIGKVSYLRYLESGDKDFLNDVISSCIIYDEIEHDKSAVDFAKESYEVLNNLKLDDSSNSFDNLRWQEYNLRIREEYNNIVEK